MQHMGLKLQVVGDLTARYAEISAAAAANAAAAAVVTLPPHAAAVLYLHFRMGTPKNATSLDWPLPNF